MDYQLIPHRNSNHTLNWMLANQQYMRALSWLILYTAPGNLDSMQPVDNRWASVGRAFLASYRRCLLNGVRSWAPEVGVACARAWAHANDTSLSSPHLAEEWVTAAKRAGVLYQNCLGVQLLTGEESCKIIDS